MLAYISDLALSVALRSMQWLFGGSSSTLPAQAASKSVRKGVETLSQANQEKLKGYHDLAQACNIRGWQVFLLYL